MEIQASLSREKNRLLDLILSSPYYSELLNSLYLIELQYQAAMTIFFKGRFLPSYSIHSKNA